MFITGFSAENEERLNLKKEKILKEMAKKEDTNIFNLEEALTLKDLPDLKSYERGKEKGKELLNIFLEEEGKYPEEIDIIIQSKNKKKCKEDLGEILYLMGVKPIYSPITKEPVALENIPKEVLRRDPINLKVSLLADYNKISRFTRVLKLAEITAKRKYPKYNGVKISIKSQLIV